MYFSFFYPDNPDIPDRDRDSAGYSDPLTLTANHMNPDIPDIPLWKGGNNIAKGTLPIETPGEELDSEIGNSVVDMQCVANSDPMTRTRVLVRLMLCCFYEIPPSHYHALARWSAS